MGGDSGRLRAQIEELLTEAGACAVGVSRAGEVAEPVWRDYEHWLAEGNEAGMGYLRNHAEIRRDPRLLLDGARSIISIAFSYHRGEPRDPRLPEISAYALLPDYHYWIKDSIRRSGVGRLLGPEGERWRICVDSTPIMERYWALRAGIGIAGDNGAVIVPGWGSEVFLAEIITTVDIAADKPMEGDCGHCGRCAAVCPTGALKRGGTIDCNKCLSYLTIEHRGPWEDPRHTTAMNTAAGRATLFGCDRCLRVCPHNKRVRIDNRGPVPIETIVNLTAEQITGTSPGGLLKGSSLKRAGRAGLLRNLRIGAETDSG